jgi:hypothetical protein
MKPTTILGLQIETDNILFIFLICMIIRILSVVFWGIYDFGGGINKKFQLLGRALH